MSEDLNNNILEANIDVNGNRKASVILKLKILGPEWEELKRLNGDLIVFATELFPLYLRSAAVFGLWVQLRNTSDLSEITRAQTGRRERDAHRADRDGFLVRRCRSRRRRQDSKSLAARVQ